MRATLKPLPSEERADKACPGGQLADEDVGLNRSIGLIGLEIIRKIAAGKKPGEPVKILTHCNAGWPATVD